MLKELETFISAVLKHWLVLMSCAVFTFLGIYVAAKNKSNDWEVMASFIAAVLMLLVASFLAWRDEYKHRVVAECKIVEGRPKIVFSGGDSLSSGTFPIHLKAINIGNRAARDVSLIAPEGESFSCGFRLISVLMPEESCGMEILPKENSVIWLPHHAFSGLVGYLKEQGELTQQTDEIRLVLTVKFTDVNDERYEEPVYVTAYFSPQFALRFWSQATAQAPLSPTVGAPSRL